MPRDIRPQLAKGGGGCQHILPFQQAFDSTVMLFNYLVAGTKPPSDVIAVEGNLITPDSE